MKKLLNFVIIEYSFLKKLPIINAYPYEIIIEPTNICQLRCPLCYTGSGNSRRSKGFMDYAIYQNIIDTLSPFAFHVFLHLWGESFLHKDIIGFISYAHKKNLATTISSNLSFPLTTEFAENIINSGLDVLTVSLDGITAEAYNQYRVGGNYEQVINNVKLLINKKKELNKKTPYYN